MRLSELKRNLRRDGYTRVRVRQAAHYVGGPQDGRMGMYIEFPLLRATVEKDGVKRTAQVVLREKGSAARGRAIARLYETVCVPPTIT